MKNRKKTTNDRLPAFVSRSLKTLTCLAGLSLLASCVGPLSGAGNFPKAPVVPPPGALVTIYKAPLDYDFSNKGEPTYNGSDLKQGTSQTHYIQLFYRPLSVAFGHEMIEQAQQNADIDEIYYADYEVLNVLGLYVNTKFHVYGK